MSTATVTRSLRRFQRHETRRSIEARTWDELKPKQRRQSIACCVYGDCTSLADHWLRGTEWSIPDGPVGLCADHAAAVARFQMDTLK